VLVVKSKCTPFSLSTTKRIITFFKLLQSAMPWQEDKCVDASNGIKLQESRYTGLDVKHRNVLSHKHIFSNTQARGVCRTVRKSRRTDIHYLST